MNTLLFVNLKLYNMESSFIFTTNNIYYSITFISQPKTLAICKILAFCFPDMII